MYYAREDLETGKTYVVTEEEMLGEGKAKARKLSESEEIIDSEYDGKRGVRWHSAKFKSDLPL